MDDQISVVCKTASYQLRRIGLLRKYLSVDATKTLMQALVTSRLDYANSLYAGLPKKQLKRLQRIQNSAARLITQTRRSQNITPIFISLHWLPVEFRVKFKICCLTYKALGNNSPAYIKELLIAYEPSRSLRSRHRNLLAVPRSRTVSFGDRAFSRIAPKLWNSLPDKIRQCPIDDFKKFKTLLKTHFFTSAFL